MYRFMLAVFLAVLAVPANASSYIEFRHLEAIRAYESLSRIFKEQQKVQAPVVYCMPAEWSNRFIPSKIFNYFKFSWPLACLYGTDFVNMTIQIDETAELSLTGQGSLVPLLFRLDERGRAVGSPIEFSECEIGVGCVRLREGKYVIFYGGEGYGNPRLSLSRVGD